MIKSNKIRKIGYVFFVITILGVIGYGAIIVFRNANLSVNTFTSDGYALYFTPNSIKADVLPFKNGSDYAYKKYGNKVNFTSNDKNVSIDDDSILHYQNEGLVVLKNTVGIDLDKIDDKVIMYYNIYKNTNINYDSSKDEYYVSAIDKKISYNKLLLRISDNKYLLVGNNIRAVLFNDQIVDFGKYLYFEYVNGSIVKLYNNEKLYQTLSSDSKIIEGDIVIDLKEKVISKDNKAKITLSNLVIDMDSVIDVIEEKSIVEKGKVTKPDISQDVLDAPESNGGASSGNIDIDNGLNNDTGEDATSTDDNENDDENNSDDNNDNNNIQEEEVDKTIVYKEPVFTLTSMSLTALKIDATVDIKDDDGLLINPVKFSIVENANAKVVYEEDLTDGNLSAYISCPNLKPDTEYTLYGKASYKIDDIVLDKTFISKIFRTEALGVSFRKSYVTQDSIVVDLYKEIYSKVGSVTLGIYDNEGTLLDYKKIDLSDKTKNKYQVIFNELEHNKSYMVKMYDILSSGVIVDDGYSQIETIETLKKAPKIGNLTYRINKPESLFELDVSDVTDEDYGIYNYRYEVFDARSDLEKDSPILTVEQKSLGTVNVLVDDSKIYRGIAYTYRLIVEFNDNEKNVEYVKNLGTVMQLDGVEFPKLRWEETKITWEQINGSIIIDDPAGTLQSNVYKVVYKNSIDLYTVTTITTETPQNVIPITINHLRANETYTFDVYASINLQDNNPTATQTYIGSVNVQTGQPKTLSANFIKNDNYSDVFSIKFALTDFNEDASFEASTLTSLNFTLYQGSTTDGKVEVFKKKVDLNDDEYISTLKQMFYDESTDINADFFDSENGDFQQKTYTLVVDGAYDYTGYDTNIIPIENNVFQFDINNYIPSIPNPDESQITVRQVLNKFASSFGLEYNDKLDNNTVVALNAIASYDNNSNSARYIIYHTWIKDPVTKEFVKIDSLDKRVDFNDDGTLSSTLIEIGQGTSIDTFDNDMIRRGNEYYLSYETFLDIDNNGEIDTIYPTSIEEGVVLKSDNIRLRKQPAKFMLYPSISDNNSMSWKYKYIDDDYALADNKLYGYINANANASSMPEISSAEDYQLATFTGLTKGQTLTIKKIENVIKSDNNFYTNLTSQYFYGYVPNINLSYSVVPENNIITFSIDDYMNKGDIIDSIANVDILIEPVNENDKERIGTKLLENVTLKNGKIIIDYFEIKEFYNVEISLKLLANYDTGETGFDYDSPYLALQNGSYSDVGNYYTFAGQLLTQVSSVYRNMMKVSFNPNNQILSLTNMQNRMINIQVDVNETGVYYDDNNLIAKNIKSDLLTSDSNVIKFDKVIPGISIYTSNHINIVPLLNGVYVNAKIVNFENTIIEDNLIYFELFETNENGTNATYLDTLSHSISEFEDSILIDNLKFKTNYYIKAYANVYNAENNTYEKTYLYDIDQQTVGCIYNFHTLSDVGIKNVKAEFITNTYSDKRLSISYELENVVGYNYIQYKLYVLTGNEYVEVSNNIPNSTNFFKNMSLQIGASPTATNQIVYGGKYKIVINAFGEYTINGVTHEIKLGENETEFEIDDYVSPYVGISSGKDEGSIYFRVTINDPSHVIVNDRYDVRLLNSNNEVVAQMNNISDSLINRRFTFTGEEHNLINGETYTFDVVTRNDYENTGQRMAVIHKTKRTQYGTNVDLGTVVLSENKTEENSFDLIFSDSYRLTSITNVSYSISSVTTGFYVSGTTNFNVRYDPNTKLYTYTINLGEASFLNDNVYLFTFNFYENDVLVNEAEFDYYYGGSNE